MIKPINFTKYYKEILSELMLAFSEFILSGQYIGGKLVEKFEDKVKKYLGAKHAIGCKSGTHALQLALLAAGVEKGDEVITVANTYYATVYAITAVGATPIFCDILPENGQIDHNKIEAKITKKTKVILPVHLYGIPVNLGEIRKICKKYKLILIEDCSHAFGTRLNGEYIGSDSDFGCFSMYPTKNLGAFGDAGFITTKNKKYESKIRELIYLTDAKRVKFNPKAIHAMLDPLQAALLLVMLDKMDQARKDRIERADEYRKNLEEYIRISKVGSDSVVNPHMFPIFIKNRNKLIKFLADSSVHVQVHYPTNLHCLSQFGSYAKGYLPETERHNREEVSLSVHPSVSISEVKKICKLIKQYVEINK
ncbi:MAG: DegT/DnrJ/EryC1/StrS family aminotransferase [Candidatus Moranbacteria bacterium]|nr:DegT/DnrJ/EryC1/StrS family aminotransferase [Candidatus Moranbacteria bacterium]